ncbi:putative protein YciO [subsurface metagenome]
MNEDIDHAVKVLEKGGLILFPTDTIWGIGCDATNTEAVDRIYRLKKRQDSKTMLVLIDNEIRLQQYIKEIPEIAWQLLDVSDKPLTIIYPGARNLALNLVAEDGSIGIRIPEDKFCQRLVSRFMKPVVSTSANVTEKKPPAIFQAISDEIKEGVDYIVNWRQNDDQQGTVSSIIKLGPGGEFLILRD